MPIKYSSLHSSLRSTEYRETGAVVCEPEIKTKTKGCQRPIPDEYLERWPELDELVDKACKPIPLADVVEGQVFAFFCDRRPLSNPVCVQHWFREQLSLRRPLCPGNGAWLVLVLAAADHASTVAESQIRRSRVALFANTVSRGHWFRCEHRIPRALDQLEDWKK